MGVIMKKYDRKHDEKEKTIFHCPICNIEESSLEGYKGDVVCWEHRVEEAQNEFKEKWKNLINARIVDFEIENNEFPEFGSFTIEDKDGKKYKIEYEPYNENHLEVEEVR